MKRRLVIAVAIIMVAASMSACGSNDEKTAKNEESIQTETPGTEKLPADKSTEIESDTEKAAAGKLEGSSTEQKPADQTADITSADTKATTSNNKSGASGSKDTSGSSGNDSSAKTNKSNSGKSSAVNSGSDSGTTTASTHTHKWVVNQGSYHMETQVVKEAWDEPVYETRELSVCNQCGADVTGNEMEHGRTHTLVGEKGGNHSEWVQVQTGTVHHDAETTEVMVWDVIPYNQCSGCGATSAVGEELIN